MHVAYVNCETIPKSLDGIMHDDLANRSCTYGTVTNSRRSQKPSDHRRREEELPRIANKKITRPKDRILICC